MGIVTLGIDDHTGRTGQAFGLVFASAGATAIGSLAVFYPRLAKFATAHVLASSLGFATGVMVYISFVDIYNKSIVGFLDQGHDEDEAFLYTTLSFFGGIVAMKIIEVTIQHVAGDADFAELAMEEMVARNEHELADAEASPSANSSAEQKKDQEQRDDRQQNGATPEQQNQHQTELQQREQAKRTFHPKIRDHSQSIIPKPEQKIAVEYSPLPLDQSNNSNVSNLSIPQIHQIFEVVEHGYVRSNFSGQNGDHCQPEMNRSVTTVGTTPEERKSLFTMGTATAVAIAMHNFPEGLVTFVAYLEDPAVGVAMAIGVAMHNLPEGLCVSMPIYYATGSRWKAFFWGSFSGFSEPLGALVGYLVLKTSFSGNTYGILFGFVSGMMIFISIDELLPMAFKFNPTGSIITITSVMGMLLVASSVILFKLGS